MSGYITYIEYQAGNKKGETNQGDLFNNPFKLGDVDVNFTGAQVVETVTEAGKVDWMQNGKFGAFDADGVFHEGQVKYQDGTLKDVAQVAVGDKVTYIYDNVVVPQNELPMLKAEMKSIPLIAKARRIAVERYAA